MHISSHWIREMDWFLLALIYSIGPCYCQTLQTLIFTGSAIEYWFVLLSNTASNVLQKKWKRCCAASNMWACTFGWGHLAVLLQPNTKILLSCCRETKQTRKTNYASLLMFYTSLWWPQLASMQVESTRANKDIDIMPFKVVRSCLHYTLCCWGHLRTLNFAGPCLI